MPESSMDIEKDKDDINLIVSYINRRL